MRCCFGPRRREVLPRRGQESSGRLQARHTSHAAHAVSISSVSDPPRATGIPGFVSHRAMGMGIHQNGTQLTTFGSCYLSRVVCTGCRSSLLTRIGGCRLGCCTLPATQVCRALTGPGLWPGPRRQARWAGRGSRVNGAPQARPAQRDAKHR